MSGMHDQPFIYIACQAGAEAAVKRELASNHPELRFAFSRPGFLTFKVTSRNPADRFQLKSIFARSYGWSIGAVESFGSSTDAAKILLPLEAGKFHQLHAWHRQPQVEKGQASPVPLDESTLERATWLITHLIENRKLPERTLVNSIANANNRVIDLIEIGPEQWWLGWHCVTTTPQRWPGGWPRFELPEKIVSRAYFKLTEALLWSELPLEPGDRCIELGSAPGGACQALLERNLSVVGVDPAEMDAAVREHANFTHWKKRAADVRRTEYAGFKWLFCDANVVPNEMLKTIEEIVNHDRTHVQGMVLTLKLGSWDDADKIRAYVDRVRSWGYKYTRVRHLATNHREVCLVALRSRGMRRRKKSTTRGRRPKPEQRSSNPVSKYDESQTPNIGTGDEQS